jgi:hypothetical protein
MRFAYEEEDFLMVRKSLKKLYFVKVIEADFNVFPEASTDLT